VAAREGLPGIERLDGGARVILQEFEWAGGNGGGTGGLRRYRGGDAADPGEDAAAELGARCAAERELLRGAVRRVGEPAERPRRGLARGFAAADAHTEKVLYACTPLLSCRGLRPRDDLDLVPAVATSGPSRVACTSSPSHCLSPSHRPSSSGAAASRSGGTGHLRSRAGGGWRTSRVATGCGSEAYPLTPRSAIDSSHIRRRFLASTLPYTRLPPSAAPRRGRPVYGGSTPARLGARAVRLRSRKERAKRPSPRDGGR